MRVHKCLAFFLSELTKMENLKNFLLKIETKRMRIALIIQRLLLGAKKRRCMIGELKAVISGEAEHHPRQKQKRIVPEQKFQMLVDIQAKLAEGKSMGYPKNKPIHL